MGCKYPGIQQNCFMACIKTIPHPSKGNEVSAKVPLVTFLSRKVTPVRRGPLKHACFIGSILSSKQNNAAFQYIYLYPKITCVSVKIGAKMLISERSINLCGN